MKTFTKGQRVYCPADHYKRYELEVMEDSSPCGVTKCRDSRQGSVLYISTELLDLYPSNSELMEEASRAERGSLKFVAYLGEGCLLAALAVVVFMVWYYSSK